MRIVKWRIKTGELMERQSIENGLTISGNPHNLNTLEARKNRFTSKLSSHAFRTLRCEILYEKSFFSTLSICFCIFMNVNKNCEKIYRWFHKKYKQSRVLLLEEVMQYR